MIAIALLSGCSLFLGDGDGSPPAGDGGPEDSDAGGDADGAASTDARATALPITECPEDMALAACYLFDGNGEDGSTNANHAVTVTGVDFANGLAGQAAVFSEDDQMTVGENGDTLDMAGSSLTVEVWVRPGAFADAADRRGIFDVNSEYSLFIDENGQVECNGAGGLPAAGQLALGQWTHVACVIEANTSITLYLDGDVMVTDSATTPTGGANAIEIGSDSPYAAGDSHYIGMLDNLVIWSVARTRAQVCATAGIACD